MATVSVYDVNNITVIDQATGQPPVNKPITSSYNAGKLSIGTWLGHTMALRSLREHRQLMSRLMITMASCPMIRSQGPLLSINSCRILIRSLETHIHPVQTLFAGKTRRLLRSKTNMKLRFSMRRAPNTHWSPLALRRAIKRTSLASHLKDQHHHRTQPFTSIITIRRSQTAHLWCLVLPRTH